MNKIIIVKQKLSSEGNAKEHTFWEKLCRLTMRKDLLITMSTKDPPRNPFY